LIVPPVVGSRLLVTRAEVDAAFERLVAATQSLVAVDQCVLLGVLLGGLVPLARLASQLKGDFLLDTCQVGRYGDEMRGGIPRWVAKPRVDLKDRHVVIVDDIHDEGVTLDFLARHCQQAGARRVTTVVLVRKRHARPVTGREPDIAGLEVGDEYVFGCGMDYQGHWRHLPEIWGLPAA
jgi:hypoxanthine phosphoribosyltransferase